MEQDFLATNLALSTKEYEGRLMRQDLKLHLEITSMKALFDQWVSHVHELCLNKGRYEALIFNLWFVVDCGGQGNKVTERVIIW